MPLSDEEFNDLLQKRLAAQDDAELQEDSELLSDQDAADLAIMREALGNYKAETLAWAEERSATMPAPRSSALATWWDRTPRWALAGLATAGAVAAFTLTHTSRPTSASLAAAPTAQVLAADNQLLSSVDQALSDGGSIPGEQELGLSSTDVLTGAQETQKRVRSRDARN